MLGMSTHSDEAEVISKFVALESRDMRMIQDNGNLGGEGANTVNQ